VTKAVSDQIGGGGMADEVIRFNGFPFLEKEDKEADHDASFEPSQSMPVPVLVVLS
jgi:chloride channel 3/4/5